MKPWQRLKNSGYRFRVYLFAGLLVFLVVMSLAFTFGVSWYSKRLSALIVEKDFKARETERTLADLLVSMDRNRKKYFLLEKPEYGRMFREDSRSFRKQLSRLEELGLSEEEEPTFLELKEQFEDYLHKDPFITGEAKVLRIEIEVDNWVLQSNVYVKGIEIVIDGTTYIVEF